MQYGIILAALPLMACSANADSDVPANGSGGNRSYAVADFARVSLKGSDNIDIRVGGDFSVRAEGPSDVLDRLKIERDGDALVVSRKNGGWADWGSRGSARVFVTMPRITAIDLGGSGDIALDRAEGQKFEAATGGSGDIRIGSIRVDSAEFAIAGSGSVTVGGQARALSMSIAGSGDIDAGALKAQGADVSIAGSGSARAQVTGAATVSVLGSGDVDLGPNARCQISKLGSGDVRCGK